MKISSSFKTDDRNRNYQSFKGVPPNPKYIPEGLGKVAKLVGEYVGMPEQKLFMATTALMLVPLIDLKYVEEDKKIDSAIKSASKAIAGGATGVAIRAGFIKLTESLIGFDKNNKFNRHFMPDKLDRLSLKNPALANLYLSKYTKTFGTFLAILFMVFFSNSKIDVPFTSDLQDLISGVVKDNKSWLQSYSDVRDIRVGKIKKWIDKWKNRFTKVGNKCKKVASVIVEDDSKAKEKNKS